MAEPLDPVFQEFYASRTKPTEKDPRLTVLLSGGGIRAMDSSIHFLDFLKRFGVMDQVDTVGGLSGGSWTCIAGGMSDGKCPFHHQPPGAPHPWSREAPNDGIPPASEVNEDSPLVKMLSQSTCDAARAAVAKDGWPYAALSVIQMSEKIHAFLDKLMGDFAFLGESLLMNNKYSTLMNWAVLLGSQILGETRDGEHAKLNQPKNSVCDLPLFLGSAVNELDTPIVYKERNQFFQWYVWDGLEKVGGIRGIYPDAENIPVHKEKFNLDRLATDKIYWKSVDGASGLFTKDWEIVMQRVMAICGSAGGIGAVGELIKSFIDKEGFRAQLMKPKTSIFGSDTDYALLVDGGACNNVPFPLMELAYMGQKTTIAIVLDCSGGQPGNAMELYRAAQDGIYTPRCNWELLKNKFADCKDTEDPNCRIILPTDPTKEPVIIYVLGEQSVSTFRMDRTLEEIQQVRAQMEKVALSAAAALAQVKGYIHTGVDLNTLDPIIIPKRLHLDDDATGIPPPKQLFAWHMYPTLFDACAEVEKAHLEGSKKANANYEYNTVDEMRADGLRYGFPRSFPALSATEDEAYQNRLKANPFIKDTVYGAFCWAQKVFELLKEEGHAAEVAKMGSWFEIARNSEHHRGNRTQMALYLLLAKVESCDNDNINNRLYDAILAWEKAAASDLHCFVKGESCVAHAVSDETEAKEALQALKNGSDEELNAIAATLGERLDIYDEVAKYRQDQAEKSADDSSTKPAPAQAA